MMRMLLLLLTGLLISFVSSAALAQQAASTAADVTAIHAFLDDLEKTFASGDIDAAAAAFLADAIVVPEAAKEIIGGALIRRGYAGMLQAFNADLQFTTDEIEVAGDMAYERGSFSLKLTDKASGQVITDTKNRHIHILKRQADGSWKTWRMMSNAVAAPAP
ncbi:MAG: DUF4440 domain-containing protein [Pseudomonadota bacterium]